MKGSAVNHAFALKSLAAALLCSASLGLAHAAEPGDVAPEIDLPGQSGQIKLAALRGKWVYVDFWASWCGPCKQSFPWLNEMQSKYGAQGLTVVGINVDTKREDAATFLKQVPAQFTIAFDTAGATPKNYKIKGMPSSVLINPEGKVVSSTPASRTRARPSWKPGSAAP
jgi:cytochrome c biogenesis protein CcmG/thiol:disulfide interchange protein DsbE